MSPVVNLAVTKAWSPLELPWPALQHCSTAVMRILHTVCTLRDTSLLLLPHIHRAQHNKQQASLCSSALSMGFWSPEKFVPAIVHIFGIAVGTRPPQSWDIYFWAQSECQLSWARTSSQLTNSCLISGSGLNFSVCRIMVMRSLSV